MGYYIQCDGRSKHKVAWIMNNVQTAIGVSQEDAAKAVTDPTKGVVCVVDNGPFEAAAFCFDAKELKDFQDPNDPRPEVWIVMDRATAEKLSGYDQRKK